uniref:NFACT RNA-binding domain-containing protein n=1 Tax=Cuerna arida TaxID=1464854 RepID=A0A1B6FD40_9HEMI
MKTKFSTFDLVCSLTELQRHIGLRVNQVYDIDQKTYLIKLQSEEKVVLLIESGCRIHRTAFEWPKNQAPSGFTMKMRKHLKNKRLEVLRQLGMDRIVDMQFGTGEAAYHVILELYDRGNIILTDYELTILNVLRPHIEGDKIKFAVKEKYPVDRAHPRVPPPNVDELQQIFSKAKPGDSLKKILNPHLEYGPAVIDHMLLKVGLPPGVKLGKGFDISQVDKLCEALQEAESLLNQALTQPSKGYIIQKAEKRPTSEGGSEELITNQEFHPYLFLQNADQLYKEFDCFDLAVDEFFSSLEAQKIDVKFLQQEREALKKLDNVKKDHHDRLRALQQTQAVDKQKAELILRNQQLVESCLLVVRTALANQLPWPAISQLIEEAKTRGDPVATAIAQLKLETNHITLHLSDPFFSDDTSSREEDSDNEEGTSKIEPMNIDIDLALTSFSNAKKYYDKKRSAAKKQQKTVESQGKALKSAEKKTKQALKEVQAMSTITKARKVFWFEKFFWFISSENYLVIGGRDQQQNELIVKRHLRGSDVYVHADLHGASSVVVKNPSPQPVPPKTLNEAGTMAICYSAAWEAKVHTSAWWVHADQVSKTAPTGEYLTTGSFMIRGKKNYLPPLHLVMGFSFLFKLEDSSVERHKDDRRVKAVEDEEAPAEPEEGMAEVELELSEDEHPDGNSAPTLENVEEVDEDEDGSQFPDTQIRVEHTNDNKVSVTSAMGSLSLQPSTIADETTVVYLGDNQPIVVKPSAQKTVKQKQQQVKAVKKEGKDEEKEKEKQNVSQVKRGQKGKLKKMKEKYKDQDEEERKLRMDILQSAGSGKVKDSKKGKKSGSKVAPVVKKPPVPKPAPAPRPAAGDGAGVESGGEDEAEGEGVAADIDMLDSLTGQPLPEDELLFAVPVVAPYNTLTNYKYKVKLTPGSGKRGKAAKVVLNMFLRDRSATNHERDLMRSVKDQNMARNIPGRVKLSAPQLQKLKK